MSTGKRASILRKQAFVAQSVEAAGLDPVHVWVRLPPEAPTGCSSVWSERLLWEQDAAGSNPATRTVPLGTFAPVMERQTCCVQNADFVGSTPTRGTASSPLPNLGEGLGERANSRGGTADALDRGSRFCGFDSHREYQIYRQLHTAEKRRRRTMFQFMIQRKPGHCSCSGKGC